jgi:carbamoyltransferase
MKSHAGEVVLGVGGYLGHDANAALFVGGELVAASQEERFTRRKHDGRFPASAIHDCLQIGGIQAGEVDVCVFAEKPFQTAAFARTGVSGNFATRLVGRCIPERMAGYYTVPARQLLPRARFRFAWHHLSHVAGAFHSSSFSRAAFLCVDGKGEDYSASVGVVDHDQVRLLFEQPYEHGLGLLYTLVTYHLGFPSFGSEYKVMGLAPYGRPVLVDALRRLCTTDCHGGLSLRQAVKFTYAGMTEAIPLVTAATGVPARSPQEPLRPEHVDLAASLQNLFEEEILKMAAFARSSTGEDNLILCGGCAQNCVAAGRLRSAGLFSRIFNSPVGGDMGSGFGAALMHLRTSRPGSRLQVKTRGFYLGSEPGPAPVQAAPWRTPYAGTLHEHIAEAIAAGHTVGWVRGRMELGARALGARSIFADPRAPGMQSRLNLAVKFRESFRPFAPAILAEDVGEWFDSSAESHYMNYTAQLLPSRRRAVPGHFASLREQLDHPRSEVQSVIHVDFSARLQTVTPDIHPDFHQLLMAFKRRTGVPILINTSFNVSGQPIVRTAVEAWESFIHTDLDLLVLNDGVYRNPGDKTREEKIAWLKQFAASA